MKKNGSPLPRFETDDDRSFFLIRLPVRLEVVAEKTSEKSSEKSSEKPSGKTPVEIEMGEIEMGSDHTNMLINKGLPINNG